MPNLNSVVQVSDELSTEQAMALFVRRHLRDLIVTGQLKPGERIVERRLSAKLNVSRTPIREALKLLERDGLVTISRNRGAAVTAFAPDEAIFLFDVISVLEGLAARRLAEKMMPDTLAAMEDLHAQMVFHYNRSQIDPYFELNNTIHDLIVTSSGNPELSSTHKRLMLRARRGRYMAIMSPARWKQSVCEHESLLHAFRAQDPNAAADIWTSHLRHTGDTLAQALLAGTADADASAAKRR